MNLKPLPVVSKNSRTGDMWHKTLEEDYVAQVRQKSLPDLLIKNGDGEIRKYINFFRFGD